MVKRFQVFLSALADFVIDYAWKIITPEKVKWEPKEKKPAVVVWSQSPPYPSCLRFLKCLIKCCNN